jgi:small subunit ribosomal protein S8
MNKIYNLISEIKIGQISYRPYIISNFNIRSITILDILYQEGYIGGYTILTNKKSNRKIKIFLKYINNSPLINNFVAISKPNNSIYLSIKQIWKLASSNSLLILSTNVGILSDKECKRLKIGGKVLLGVS